MPKPVRNCLAAIALITAANVHAINFILPLSGFDSATGSLTDVIAFSTPTANAGLAPKVTGANLAGYHISDLAFSVGGPGGFSLAAAPVPEPDTWALIASGILVLGVIARRRSRA